MPTDPRDAARAQQIAADAFPGALSLLSERRRNRLAEDIQQALAEARAETPAIPAGCVAFRDVVAERIRQDAKWGEQNHDPFTYLTVLVEEVGELAQAALHARFGGPAAVKLREEAVQTAAVAVAIVECLDRDMWTFRTDVDNSGMPLPIPAPTREER